MSIDDVLELARCTIRQESIAVAAVADQLDERFVEVVRRLLACQGHVLVAGAGTSHAIAARLAHLLSCCGTPALCIDAGDSQHGLSAAVTGRDVLIALSKGGETAEINHLARIARKRQATVIALTERPESSLGQLSDLVLRVQAPPEADLYGVIATGSSLVNSALGDALCVALLHLRGHSLEAFAENHPGGAVGRKLAKRDPDTTVDRRGDRYHASAAQDRDGHRARGTVRGVRPHHRVPRRTSEGVRRWRLW